MLRSLRKAWGRFREVIRDLDGDPYLVRYRPFFWLSRKLPLVGWLRGLYLHHILRSDRDREHHDHPFDFWSLILWGGYYEHIGDGIRASARIWRGPGSFVRREAIEFHRIELRDGRRAWTLFHAGAKTREWGFMCDTGWMDQKVYHKWRAQPDHPNNKKSQELVA